MMRLDGLRASLAIGAMLLLAGGAAHAIPFTSADTYFQASGPPITDNQSGNGSVSALSQLDATNLALATVDAAAGSVGIQLQTSLSGAAVSGNARAEYEETWTCAGSACLVTPLIPVSFLIHVSGVVSPDWTSPLPGDTEGLGGSIAFGSERFAISIGSQGVQALHCISGSCTPVALASTLLPNGDLSISDDLVFSTSVANVFSSDMRFAGNWDTVSQASTADFAHTLRFAVASADPNASWTSDSGRISVSVPEPGSVALLATALGLLAFTSRRRV